MFCLLVFGHRYMAGRLTDSGIMQIGVVLLRGRVSTLSTMEVNFM